MFSSELEMKAIFFIVLWVSSVLGQQCDVVVTSQAALNKELKTLLSNLDVQVDGNISCSKTCDGIAGKIDSLGERLDEIVTDSDGNISCSKTYDDIVGKIALLEGELDDKLDKILANITEQVSSLQTQLNSLHLFGKTQGHPAASCADILFLIPNSLSGYYWLETSSGLPVQQYCDMTRSCGGVTGGWRRVAYLDMTNSSHQCPSGLRQRTDSNKRTCVRNSDSAGCSSVTISTATLGYSRVCGKITAYQFASVDAFSQSGTIDTPYVDGVSLTHGSPREHIWTFAAAVHEASSFPISQCPCLSRETTPQPPAFVGNDYFCDTGSSEDFLYIFYSNDPLWDGAGCGPLSTCCSFNNPPWFYKQLQQPTTDDIEMRVCRDEIAANEDVKVETVEIYVK